MNSVQVRPGGPCFSAYSSDPSFSAPQTLLIDGYISQTFRSRAAEQYFLNLLKSTSVPPHTALSYPGREGNFFFLHSVPSHIPAQHSSPPGRWLLDRGVVARGTVVPQTMWSPHTATDRRQQVDLQMPIFFEGTDGRLGISLEASAAGQCHGLRDASYPAQLGERTTTNLRIVVRIVFLFYLQAAVVVANHSPGVSYDISGPGTGNSNARSKSATRRARTTPSPSPC